MVTSLKYIPLYIMHSVPLFISLPYLSEVMNVCIAVFLLYVHIINWHFQAYKYFVLRKSTTAILRHKRGTTPATYSQMVQGKKLCVHVNSEHRYGVTILASFLYIWNYLGIKCFLKYPVPQLENTNTAYTARPSDWFTYNTAPVVTPFP